MNTIVHFVQVTPAWVLAHPATGAAWLGLVGTLALSAAIHIHSHRGRS